MSHMIHLMQIGAPYFTFNQDALMNSQVINSINLNENKPFDMNIYFKYHPLYPTYNKSLNTGSKIIFLNDGDQTNNSYLQHQAEKTALLHML